jgi:hypothetical protein
LHTRFEFEVGDSQLPLQYFYAEMVGESQHVAKKMEIQSFDWSKFTFDGFTGLATGLDFSKIKKRASNIETGVPF